MDAVANLVQNWRLCGSAEQRLNSLKAHLHVPKPIKDTKDYQRGEKDVLCFAKGVSNAVPYQTDACMYNFF